MAARNDFWLKWRHSLLHASALYWQVQGLLVVFLVVSSAVLLLPYDSPEATGPALRLLRIGIETLLVVGATHVAIRPVLRFWFVAGAPPWRGWLWLASGLLALSAATSVTSYLISEHVVHDGLNINAIQFRSERAEFEMAFAVPMMFALGALNMLTIYVVWVIGYLACKAFQSRRQLQAQLREARMRQLTHQLNPHFLFNAFNTIRGMIFEDRERAAQLVTQLSELFRFHLSHELRTEQTLAEEWRLAERYLDVESVRLESRLRVEVNLDPACLERKLPSLTVLTLVENAIKHGVAPIPEGGDLRIRASSTSEGWQLEVENCVGTGGARYGGNGTGLANLRERLVLGLGQQARLDIDRSAHRFTIRLELPA